MRAGLVLCICLLASATTGALAMTVTPRISAGNGYTMSIKSDGSLWGLGGNYYGQLGDGSTTNSPVNKQTGTGYSAISASKEPHQGWSFTVALKPDGSLWTWGINGTGQLGDGTTTDSYVPIQIGAGYAVISAGGTHSVALKPDGSLWAWGTNESGQLGDGGTTDSYVPKQIGIGYTAISAGNSYTAALKADGGLWTWGSNGSGALGDGSLFDSHVPKQIGAGYTAIAAGSDHVVALKSDGSLWAWGGGRLGSGVNSSVPIQIGTGYTAIAAGLWHTVALKSDGSLWAWGENENGQLGNGLTTPSDFPEQIGTGYTAIAAGNIHTVALKTDGSLWAWGLYLETYNNIAANSLVPQYIDTGYTVTTVTEFYNTNLDNYFITADAYEAAAIDNGSAGPGWSRTGNKFISGGNASVCRFYGSQSPGPNSHFYTADSSECEGLKQLAKTTPATQKRWNYESLDFLTTLPTATGVNGTCPTGTFPVYRAYNNGFARGIDSNHRITTGTAAIQEVVSRGWKNEGVVMCAPQ